MPMGRFPRRSRRSALRGGGRQDPGRVEAGDGKRLKAALAAYTPTPADREAHVSAAGVCGLGVDLSEADAKYGTGWLVAVG